MNTNQPAHARRIDEAGFVHIEDNVRFLYINKVLELFKKLGNVEHVDLRQMQPNYRNAFPVFQIKNFAHTGRPT